MRMGGSPVVRSRALALCSSACPGEVGTGSLTRTCATQQFLVRRGGAWRWVARLLAARRAAVHDGRRRSCGIARTPFCAGERYATLASQACRLRCAPRILDDEDVMIRFRTALGGLAAGLLVALLAASISLAQSWPQRSVRFIVSLGPGSGADI